jgi:hypothetical protein
VPQDPTDEPAERLLERIRQQRQAEPAPTRGGTGRRSGLGRPGRVQSDMPLFRRRTGRESEGGDP